MFHHFGPVQQQIVIIHDVLLLLALSVLREQLSKFFFPLSKMRNSA